jgi:hypothetical protein
MLTRRAFALSVLLLSASSCSFFRRGPGVQHQDTIIDVRNNGFSDVVVYLLTGGADPFRLGTANGNGSSTFRVRSALLGTGVLQLLARPIGARSSYTLPIVSVTPGDHVEVTLESSPAHAQVVVLPREP